MGLAAIIPFMALAEAALSTFRGPDPKPWKWGPGPDPDRPGWLPELPPPPAAVIAAAPSAGTPAMLPEAPPAVPMAPTPAEPLVIPVARVPVTLKEVEAMPKPYQFRAWRAIQEVSGFGLTAERPATTWVPGYDIPGGVTPGFEVEVPQLRQSSF